MYMCIYIYIYIYIYNWRSPARPPCSASPLKERADLTMLHQTLNPKP